MQRYGSDKLLAEIYGVSRSTIWRWAASGILPKPVQLSPGCSRWRMEDIEKRHAELAGKQAG
jgi:prophage regulatory protein